MSDTDQTTETPTPEETQGPDWNSPSSVTAWFGSEILSTYRTMSRGQKAKAETRLYRLGQSLDTWAKLYRLSAETSELAELRSELDALRAEIETGRKTGPAGVVRG